MRIGIVHPELMIGGAERVMVDAALSLQDLGHRVTLLTAAHDRRRCFPETVDGSLDVRVIGRRLPAQLLRHLRAPLNIARMMYVCARIDATKYDILLTDLVPHIVRFLKQRTGLPVAYYCHFPDCLLQRRVGPLYRFYRAPIDRLETNGMHAADKVFVNSRYTASVLAKVFPKLDGTELLHPGVKISAPRSTPKFDTPSSRPLFLAIGRIVEQKNFAVAIDALARVNAHAPAMRARLVIAGGFDARSAGQPSALACLRRQIKRLRLDDSVEICPSCSAERMRDLMGECAAVVHTPANEHFGLVPLEAMAAGRPVIAVNAAGPTETVIDGETGFLVANSAAAFASSMLTLARQPKRSAAMGLAGHEHVMKNFSRDRFGARLSQALETTRHVFHNPVS